MSGTGDDQGRGERSTLLPREDGEPAGEGPVSDGPTSDSQASGVKGRRAGDSAAKQARERRLAEQLRANLRRRKDQTRARRGGAADRRIGLEKDGPEEPGGEGG